LGTEPVRGSRRSGIFALFEKGEASGAKLARTREPCAGEVGFYSHPHLIANTRGWRGLCASRNRDMGGVRPEAEGGGRRLRAGAPFFGGAGQGDNPTFEAEAVGVREPAGAEPCELASARWP